MRRFPAPWTVEALDGGGFKIVDWNGQSLAYVYGHADPRVGPDGRKGILEWRGLDDISGRPWKGRERPST